MSAAYGTLDQAVPSAHPHAQQPLADRSGQQPGGWSPYVGLHRRRHGQGLDLDDAQHRFHDAVRARAPGSSRFLSRPLRTADSLLNLDRYRG